MQIVFHSNMKKNNMFFSCNLTKLILIVFQLIEKIMIYSAKTHPKVYHLVNVYIFRLLRFSLCEFHIIVITKFNKSSTKNKNFFPKLERSILSKHLTYSNITNATYA